MESMAADLKSLLEDRKVHADIIAALEADGCHSIQAFADWHDKPSDWSTTVEAAGVTDRSAKAHATKLKGLMRDCKNLAERASKRQADGLPTVDLDDPLPHEIQADAFARSSAFYHWNRWDSRAMLCDGQFARVYREFRIAMITLIQICKCRCQAASTRPATSKKQKIGDKVTVVIDDDSHEGFTSDLYSWTSQFAMLIAAWAVAGNFEIEFTPEGGNKSKFWFILWHEVILTCLNLRLKSFDSGSSSRNPPFSST